jgi:hypothetical protein
LKPLDRATTVVAPVSIAITAIQRSVEGAAPRDLSGQSGNPVSSLLSQATIGLTVSRGNMAVDGKANELIVITPVNGSLQIAGMVGATAGALTGTITGLLDKTLGKDVGQLTSRVLNQKVEVHGQVIVHAKPALTANWRIDPNLSGQVSMGGGAVQVAGIRINSANEAKPVIDQELNKQLAAVSARLRGNPFFERAAREQWTSMCRSIPLGGGDTGLPPMWLETRPLRASASQPRIDARAVTVAIGVEAATRIVGAASKPACPFPEKLELVPPRPDGRLSIALPIDMPFTTISKTLSDKLKGRRFPEGGDLGVEVEVRSAKVAASGDRLLISLNVKVHERKSWFGFGADANVHIWGKPALDRRTQVVRLSDIALDVDSNAAFGLIGTAARAAIPYLQQALADAAVLDLKPFLADAKKSIGKVLAEQRDAGNGVTVDAAVQDLELAGIDFDSNTLRLVAEARGTASVAVTHLPAL